MISQHIGKAITGGHAPLAATLCSAEIANAVHDDFSFYSTFGWHPLGILGGDPEALALPGRVLPGDALHADEQELLEPLGGSSWRASDTELGGTPGMGSACVAKITGLKPDTTYSIDIASLLSDGTRSAYSPRIGGTTSD